MARKDIEPYDFTSDQSRTEAAKNGRKGGKKSGESRRKAKAMRETAEILLSMPLNKGELANIEGVDSLVEINGQNIDVNTAIITKVIQNALCGDLQAATFLRDITNQKPAERVEMTANVSETANKLQKVLLEGKKNEPED